MISMGKVQTQSEGYENGEVGTILRGGKRYFVTFWLCLVFVRLCICVLCLRYLCCNAMYLRCTDSPSLLRSVVLFLLRSVLCCLFVGVIGQCVQVFLDFGLFGPTETTRTNGRSSADLRS